MNDAIFSLVNFIYGTAAGPEISERLERILADAKIRMRRPEDYDGGFPLDEGDVFLITYADQFREDGRPPLATLKDFLDTFLHGIVQGVHILPFSPYSSDDGFSVIDFRAVNPDWGGWEEIETIAEEYRFMADLVLNHCSKESAWFQAFLRDEEPYRDFFITVPPGTDVSEVFRPRTHPLLTEFETAAGKKLVWTTFSDDQTDLNYANPDVLLEMIRILLFYIEKGARAVRLDAVAFLWKELGTPCLHHPKTHAAVKLLRAVAEEVCPWVVIITETNVPHKENLSYLGDGDEAHMVYQFALPPLILHAFMKTDSRYLQKWAEEIRSPGPGRSFFNFCASHDGIGVLPARGILPEEELADVFAAVEERGGFISNKSTPEGDVPYELNINYFSAVAETSLSEALRVRKFVSSQSILLAMPGVPGIYVHSIIGSENWRPGVEESGIKRRINRRKLRYDEAQDELSTPDTARERVFAGFEILLMARIAEKAFHPLADSRVVPTGPEVFALLRIRRPADGPGRVLCLASLSPKDAEVAFSVKDLGMTGERFFTDIISGDAVYPSWDTELRFSLALGPFEVLWLRYGTEAETSS